MATSFSKSTRSDLAIWTLSSVVFIFVAGCSTVSRTAGFSTVGALVSERSGEEVQWHQHRAQEEQAKRIVDSLLEGKLSEPEVVQIALLNNKELQAAFEQLGIAQSELIEAGQLENPSIVGTARLPGNSENGTNIELELGQNLVQLLFLPLQRELAEKGLQESELRVADKVLSFISEVKSAYYSHLAARQLRELLATIVDSAEASFLLSQRLFDAGNVSELELKAREDMFESAKVALAKSELEVRLSREELNRLMGLWGVQTKWSAAEQLPAVPAEELPLTELESRAVSNRLDLQAAKKEVELAADALGITRKWRWIATAEIGASAERELDGTWVIGPQLALELPMFNQKQGVVRRQEAMLRRSVNELVSLAVEIRSEVRAHRERLLLSRSLVDHYRRRIMPLREKIVELSQEQYNFMLVGAFELLRAREHEVEAYREYVDAVRDYWIARAELERVTGDSLKLQPQQLETETVPEQKAEQRTDHHQHHGGH